MNWRRLMQVLILGLAALAACGYGDVEADPGDLPEPTATAVQPLSVMVLTAAADTHVRTDYTSRRNDNYGCQQALVIGTGRGGDGKPYGSADAMRALLRFDLPVLQHQAIRHANLWLAFRSFDPEYACVPQLKDPVFTINVHRTLAAWEEGNGAENNFFPPGCVNVDDANGVAWAGQGDNTDPYAANNVTQPAFDAAEVASRQIHEGSSATGDLLGWDITSLARDWQQGKVPNYGVTLRDPTEASPRVFRGVLFGSREGEAYDFPTSCGLPKQPGPRLVLDLCDDADDDGVCDDAPMDICNDCPGATSWPHTCPCVTAVADATVRRWSSQNEGDRPDIDVGPWFLGDGTRSLLRFDLSGVPAHKAIKWATLRLHVTAVTDDPPPLNDFTVDVNRIVSAPWEEMSVTWATQPTSYPVPEATWAIRAGTATGNSFDWDLTSLARAWHQQVIPNYGVALHDLTPFHDNRTINFASREGSSTNGPRLLLDLCDDLDDDGYCDTEPMCVAIQRGRLLGDVADALIAGDGRAYKNYGKSGSLTAGGGTLGTRQGLLRFDLSWIPQRAQITSASAELYRLLYLDSSGAAVKGSYPLVPVRAHTVTAPWSESTVTWANFGGMFDPVQAALFPYKIHSDADLTNLVQAWVSGTVANNGLLLERDINGYTVFASSETTVRAPGMPTVHPLLNVCFITPAN